MTHPIDVSKQELPPLPENIIAEMRYVNRYWNSSTESCQLALAGRESQLRAALHENQTLLSLGAEQAEQILKLTAIARTYRNDHLLCVGEGRCDNCKEWDRLEGKENN